jgi:coenzyme F420-reducing hydrogenase beta subunit
MSPKPKPTRVAPNQDGCYGCFACFTACPVSAIEMCLDPDGFYRPVVNAETCTSCGRCVEVCPMHVKEQDLPDGSGNQPKVYASWSTNGEVRCGSSSGGVFSELASEVLEGGGAVAGCVWGEGWVPEHRLARSGEEVLLMRGSKYAPSYVGGVYRDIIDCLDHGGQTVLFSGTPCQVAAAKRLVNEVQRKKLILCDVVCHGVPSLRVFHLYLNSLFESEVVVEYTFRSKLMGWVSPLAVSERGRQYNAPASRDAFIEGYVGHHLFLQPECYRCPFQNIPRQGDISLGDFWNVPKQLYHAHGVSIITVNTAKGEKMINSTAQKGRIAIVPSNLHRGAVKTPRLVSGIWPIPRNRVKFMADVRQGLNFDQLVRKYYPGPLRSFVNRAINKARRVLQLRSLGY